MKIAQQSVKILTPKSQLVPDLIERSARTCYQSQTASGTHARETFLKNLIDRKHMSCFEHVSVSVEFTTTRAISHQLVRHRLASFAQESQRYCNYSKNRFGNDITFIPPVGMREDSPEYIIWLTACGCAESAYFDLLEEGCSPETARSVLPNSTQTRVMMTANVREWRHILKLRLSKNADPGIREIMLMLLIDLLDTGLGFIFEDVLSIPK